MELRLEAVAGPDAGALLRYEGCGTLVFGRAGTPDRDGRRPVDPHLSREHLILEIAPGGVWATAVGQKAGFAVGGRSVPRASLADGDEITVGRSRFRVRIDLEAASEVESGSVAPVVPRRALSEFEIGQEIGSGTWGIVSEGRDRSSGERVAIKRLRDDVAEGVVRRYFVREIDVAARLAHPNVVRTVAVGREGGPLFFAMERVDGTDLDRRIDRSGPLSAAETIEVGIGILRALAHAHAAGIVHRDVKPANVLVRSLPAGLEALVADFGLARRFRDAGATSLTGTGEARGTAWFAAPESLRDAKRVGPAADVFGAGATLYYALTARPWFGETAGRIPFEAILDGRLRPLLDVRADVAPALAAVVEHALRADPYARPASAAAMLGQLVAATSTGAATTKVPSRPARGSVSGGRTDQPKRTE